MNKKITKQSERFQLTINNPIESGYTHEHIFNTFRDNFSTLDYLCMADEQGSTFHTHIFVVFTSRVRFSTVKRHFPEAHIEPVKGTASQNVNYIKKTGKWENDQKHETQIEGSFEEYGTCPPDSMGKRKDLTQLYGMISDGLTNAEIIALNQDYIMQLDKMDGIRITLLFDLYKEIIRYDLKVIYIYGETGTGKTSGVLRENGIRETYRVTDYSHPFDSYTGQKVLVFDEFRSSLRLEDMLNYCDIYPLELPARYNNKYACYLNVFIISNWELEKQYSDLQKNDKESWVSFLRRIHEVRVYTHNGITVYNSVSEYLNRNNNFHTITKEEQDGLPF